MAAESILEVSPFPDEAQYNKHSAILVGVDIGQVDGLIRIEPPFCPDEGCLERIHEETGLTLTPWSRTDTATVFRYGTSVSFHDFYHTRNRGSYEAALIHATKVVLSFAGMTSSPDLFKRGEARAHE